MSKDDLLIWRGESGMYLCAHPRIDLISQGHSPNGARSALLSSLALMALHLVDEAGVVRFRLATPETSSRWAQMAAEYGPTSCTNPNCMAFGDEDVNADDGCRYCA